MAHSLKLLALAAAAAVGIGSVSLIARAADEPKPEASATPAAKTVRAEADAEGFVPLFNGRDLTGWDGNPKFWSVKDGTITGQTTAENPTKGNTFLIYTGGDVDNFELRFRYKIVGGNSVVQYRSKVKDPKSWSVGGYQADFEAGKTYSGILYDEGGVAGGRQIMANRGNKVTYTADGQKKEEDLRMSSEELQKTIKNEDWNDYVITADGNHLTHKINGNTTAEVIDESPKALKSGVLALQLHAGPPMTVQFKDLKIKKLKGGEKPAKN